MEYTDRQLSVLREFDIIDASGKFIERKLLRPEDKPLGLGPKLDPKAANLLLKADSSDGQIWLEWLFNEAAGGATGKESSERALEQMKQRFMDERTHGYQHARTREIYPKISKEEAEERWKANAEPHFREVLFKADQDSVEKLGVWGFYRHWPGRDNLYERVTKALKKWLELLPKTRQMNDEIAAEGKERLPLVPGSIPGVEQMEALTKKVERYYASKKARVDIRLARWKGDDFIYNDDVIMALAPLTFAASVRYGCDGWQWANRDQFERVLTEDQAFADAWKANTERGKFYVYLRFKRPVPRWVARRNDKFIVHELTNLAVECEAGKVPGPDAMNFFNEEGSNAMRYTDIVQMLRHEPHRLTTDEVEMPIKRGPNVYTTAEEAELLIQHFNYALREVNSWLKEFKPKKEIVVDAMATLSAESPAEQSS